MQRIAHVISARHTIGGAERVVRALVTAGDTAGYSQVVLNPFAAGTKVEEIVPAGSPTSYAGRAGDGARDFPSVRGWLRRELGHFAPDLIHSHLFHASALIASLGRGSERARVLTHHHGNIFRVQERKWESYVDKLVTRRFPVIVAVSDAVRTFLRVEYALPASRVVTITNGWEGFPRPDIPKASAPTIISVGNLRSEKGHATLLHAFAIVRERIEDARLVIVGEGSEYASLQQLAHQLDLDGAVEFRGAVDDVWPLLAASHVFALPSLVEQLGIAAMEAMAAGLPVVASDVGGVGEIVKDGVTGWLVPPRDPAALGSNLLGLLQDPAVAQAMGERARRSVRDRTMEHMSETYLGLYDRLLTNNR